MASSPVRLPDDFYEAASETGPAHGRSTAQGITHWVRIGREYKRVAVRDVEEVFDNSRLYDSLTDSEQ